MLAKGYEHPIYSLDLLTGPGALSGDPDRVISVDQGVLIAPPALLHVGAKLPTADVLGALAVVLYHQSQSRPVFAAAGLDDGWASGMRHWGLRLQRADRQLRALGYLDDVCVQLRVSLRRSAQELWTRLRLAHSMVRVGGALVSGAMPTGDLRLIDELQRISQRLQQGALSAALAQCGFDLSAQDALRRVPERLMALNAETSARRRQRAVLRGEVVVMRGALCGDMRIFCTAARLAFAGDPRGSALRLPSLLGQPAQRGRARRPSPQPAAPPSPQPAAPPSPQPAAPPRV